jgi:hypothetical protein
MSDEGQIERRMIVVHVRLFSTHVEVMFAESARIYRLERDNPAFEVTLANLRAAAASHRPLRVRFDMPNGDVIARVHLDTVP